jgi:hypothetical protein
MYLDDKNVLQFHQQGFVIIPNVFTREEVARMSDAVGGARVANHTTSMLDTSGLATKLAIWFEIGGDLWSAVTTCPRLVSPLRILIGRRDRLLSRQGHFQGGKDGRSLGVASGLWLLVRPRIRLSAYDQGVHCD